MLAIYYDITWGFAGLILVLLCKKKMQTTDKQQQTEKKMQCLNSAMALSVMQLWLYFWVTVPHHFVTRADTICVKNRAALKTLHSICHRFSWWFIVADISDRKTRAMEIYSNVVRLNFPFHERTVDNMLDPDQ